MITKKIMASISSSTNKVTIMEQKTADPRPDPQQQTLKCPRCDSSNTKFCYYNNYSLSQPRHFCKACKRYWTRGGTLRNVPVGGGCRKNKRVRRSQPSNSSNPSSISTHIQVQPSDPSPASNNNIVNNPSNLFYSSTSTNPMELNFPFSRFSSIRVSSELSAGLIDHPHQLNHGLGLGFSHENGEYNNNNGFRQIQDQHSISNPNFFGSSNNFASTSTMASLFASSLQQHKFGLKEIQANHNDDFPGLMAYDQLDMQLMQGGNGVVDILGKEVVKMEGENRLDHQWNNQNNNNNILGQQQQQIDNSNIASDSSSLLWNTNNNNNAAAAGTTTVWFDPSNIGSSVPSLI